MKFFKAVALLGGAIVLIFLGIVITDSAISAQSDDQYQIIDAHVHFNFNNRILPETGFAYSKAEFLKQAKEAGLIGFVNHTYSPERPIPTMPGLIPTFCAGVHEEVPLALIEAGLKSGKFKCIKIYLGYAHKFAADESYQPLYDLAEKMGVPVVFHTGDTSTTDALVKYAQPLTIDEVAVSHPHVTFVMAHVGNPWFQDAAEVAYKNPNVYLDASGIMVGDLSRFSQEDFQKYLIGPVNWVFGYVDNPRKMMFGTDWPLVNIKQYLNVVVRAIPVQYRRAFLHDNAARVFHIHDGIALGEVP